MDLNEKRYEQAKEISEILANEGRETVRGVILYGSVARGESDEGSDVDLFVVIDDKKNVESLEKICEKYVSEEMFIKFLEEDSLKNALNVGDRVYTCEILEAGDILLDRCGLRDMKSKLARDEIGIPTEETIKFYDEIMEIDLKYVNEEIRLCSDLSTSVLYDAVLSLAYQFYARKRERPHSVEELHERLREDGLDKYSRFISDVNVNRKSVNANEKIERLHDQMMEFENWRSFFKKL